MARFEAISWDCKQRAYIRESDNQIVDASSLGNPFYGDRFDTHSQCNDEQEYLAKAAGWWGVGGEANAYSYGAHGWSCGSPNGLRAYQLHKISPRSEPSETSSDSEPSESS